MEMKRPFRTVVQHSDSSGVFASRKMFTMAYVIKCKPEISLPMIIIVYNFPIECDFLDGIVMDAFCFPLFTSAHILFFVWRFALEICIDEWPQMLGINCDELCILQPVLVNLLIWQEFWPNYCKTVKRKQKHVPETINCVK
jgi:hypothetical protein